MILQREIFLLVQKVILQKNGFLPIVIFAAKAIMRIVLSVIRESQNSVIIKYLYGNTNPSSKSQLIIKNGD